LCRCYILITVGIRVAATAGVALKKAFNINGLQIQNLEEGLEAPPLMLFLPSVAGLHLDLLRAKVTQALGHYVALALSIALVLNLFHILSSISMIRV